MSTTPPLLQKRAAVAHVFIPLAVSSEDGLRDALPETFAELQAWAREHDVSSIGAPFVRFRTLAGTGGSTVGAHANAAFHPSHATSAANGGFDVEVGWPASATAVDRMADRVLSGERVQVGALTPGTYVTLIHTGPPAGLSAVAAELLAWCEANGIAWHRSDESRAAHWEARIESRLTDPAVERDPEHWQTEIAFLTKEG